MVTPVCAPSSNIYLKFEVWDPATQKHEPLGNMFVRVLDDDPIGSDLLDVGVTNAGGEVQFSSSEYAKKAGAGDAPDIYFLANTKGRTVGAGMPLPDEWSTKQWLGTKGERGYYEDWPKDVPSRQLGTCSDPITFRVGLDVHIRFKYEHKDLPGHWEPIPAHVTVEARLAYGTLVPLLGSFASDDQGEAHLVFFNVPDPDAVLRIGLRATMQSASIGLPSCAAVEGTPLFGHAIPIKRRTTIGTHSSPEEVSWTDDSYSVSMFFLKLVSEWSIFLFNVTGGAWSGVQPLLRLFMSSAPMPNSFSWPVGYVSIHHDAHWLRATILHELSHQILWKESSVSSISVLAHQLCSGHTHHVCNMTHSGPMSLFEGWAEFIEVIFMNSYKNVDLVTFAFGAPATTSLHSVPNLGERVEGAFANAMFDVFKSYVGGNPIAPSRNGNSFQSWMSDANVVRRFKAAIWEPLRALSKVNSPCISDFVDAMRASVAADWHLVAPHLQRWNIGKRWPTLTSVNPPSAPAGARVNIDGTEFVSGQMEVTIGGYPTANVSVISSTRLSCDVPPAGAPAAPVPVDIVVTTVTQPHGGSRSVVGSATLARAFTYQ